MNKQQTNQMSSIRKKLMAAVAMLLVACIMTVSSTYAWFTLSTAPEVKGITTTVGANGNLEIALGNFTTTYGTGTDSIPTSSVGDSKDATNQTITAANETWGNLIDLSDASYGLNAIKLYPSRLNANGNSLTFLSPLSFPKYGSDGRITELDENTMLGKYNSDAKGFLALATPNYAGVSGIGSASSMSERQFAVRNARTAIETNRVTARNEAQGAINLYAGDLAAIAINYQNEAADSTKPVTAEDVAVLNALITKLEQSNAAIGDSIKSALLVFLASESSNLSDTAWKDALTSIGSQGLVDMVATIQGLTGVATLPTAVNEPIQNYKDIAADLKTAKDTLTAAATDSVYTWAEVGSAVNILLNGSGILICGETVSDIVATKGSTEPTSAYQIVLKEVLSDTGLTFQFSETSGIFSDIAEMVGEYSATISFPEGLVVESIPLGGLKKPVAVKSPSDQKESGELGVIYLVMSSEDFDAPGVDATAATALTDTYGYVIDMLFRTNAADSYLQLQTNAVNRVYAEGGSEATAGGGSNMSFTVGGEYDTAKIDKIAAGIRVVFYKTASTINAGTADIVAVATLGTGTATGGVYKMPLQLSDYTIDANGKITINASTITDNPDTAANEAVALTALTANVKTGISALVYLDGDAIDNSDAGVEAVLNGKLNLQFSSSVTLKPMVNNELQNMEVSTTE